MWLSFTLPYPQYLDQIGHLWTLFKSLSKRSHPIHVEIDAGIQMSAGAMKPVTGGEATRKQSLSVIVSIHVPVFHAYRIDNALADLYGKTRVHHAGIVIRDVRLCGVESWC